MDTQNLTDMRVTVKRMFRNCPKPSGWFGCFAHIRGQDGDIKLTGTTSLPLAQGMQLDIKARPDPSGPDAYIAVEITPVTQTRTGMTSYLASLPGVSRLTAGRLVQQYGANVLDIIKTDPRRIIDDLKFPEKIVTALVEGVTNGDAKNQLRQALPEFSPQIIERIYGLLNPLGDPMTLIKSDPYRLTDIPGISFARADAVALRLGVDPLSPYRVNHGLVHVLETDGGNDTYVNLNDPAQCNRLTAALEWLLSIRLDGQNELANRVDALAAIDAPPVAVRIHGAEKRLFLSKIDTAVSIVAAYVRNNSSVSGFPDYSTGALNKKIKAILPHYACPGGYALTKEQAAAVTSVLKNRLSVITGGPGRGKTTIIDCVASSLTVIDAKAVPILLAPTGRAMNKLRTATNSNYETMTVDRLIVSSRSERSQYRKLNNRHTLFIIDESSMLDIQKVSEIIDLFPLAKYCFVGDVDQLPPIGKGRFLSDLISCGRAAVSYLTIPLRNGGLILENAGKITAGDTNLTYNFTEMPFFPQAADNKTALETILDQYNDERQDCPDITEIALLCPVKKGPTGVISLNIALQDTACPETTCTPVLHPGKQVDMVIGKGYPIQSTIYGSGEKWTRFRVGDIVMNTKNNYELLTYEYEHNDYWANQVKNQQVGVFNGDCGRIIAYVPKWARSDTDMTPHEYIVVQLFNGRIIELDVTLGEFETFELGYAMTVHKAQGCEYQTVIYVSPDALKHMTRGGFANRNLPYTGVTRAKRRVVVMGTKESLHACIETPLPSYNTDFSERI